MSELTTDERADVARELGSVMEQLTGTAVALQTAVLKPYGLTLIQSLPLKLLWQRQEPLDMAHLSDALALPPSTLTNVVDRLERDELARRQPHETDRRRVMVSITPKGQALVDDLDALALRMGVQMLTGIADSEVRATSAVLRRIAEEMARMDASGEFSERTPDF